MGAAADISTPESIDDRLSAATTHGAAVRAGGFLRNTTGLAIAISSVVLAACGPAPVMSEPDGGPTTSIVAPPAPPVAPMLTPCPVGWTETTTDGLTWCDPLPGETTPACPSAQARFIGTDGCAPIGAPCGPGEFAADLPADSVLYVRVGAIGGDGSLASPFGAINDALAVASPGVVIALSRGRFDEILELPSGVTLRGACASETALGSSVTSGTEATVTVHTPNVTLRDLSISDSARVAVYVRGTDASLTLEHVAIERNQGFGLLMGAGHVTAVDLIVRGTDNALSRSYGVGIDVELGGSIEVRGGVVQGSHGIGVNVIGAGSSALFEDVVIAGTEGRWDGSEGQGVKVGNGAHVTLRRALLDGNAHIALFTAQGTDLALEDVVVRRTRPEESTGLGGWGIVASAASTVDLRRVVVDGGAGSGVAVEDSASLTAGDLLVRAVESAAETTLSGYGLQVATGGQATVSRAAFVGNRSAGISLAGAGVVASLSDIEVRNTRPDATNGLSGVGVQVGDGATLALDRAAFVGNHLSGVLVTEADATLTDVVIEGTLASSSGIGSGAHVEDSRLSLLRAVLERNAGYGIEAMGASTVLALDDLAVRDTEPASAGSLATAGTFGIGLLLQQGAQGAVHRAEFSRNHDRSVVAFHEGTSLVLEDVTIEDNLPQVSDGARGAGLTVGWGAALRATRLTLDQTDGSGFAAAGVGTVAVFDDLTVRRGLGSREATELSSAFLVQAGAHAEVRGAVFEDNEGVAVAAIGDGTTLALTSIEIRGTRTQACPVGACLGGFGVVAGLSASVDVEDFVIAGSDVCGVHVAFAGALTLRRGELSTNTIGACVHDAAYDVTRLTEGVTFRDNGTNVETLSLPTPTAAPFPTML